MHKWIAVICGMLACQAALALNSILVTKVEGKVIHGARGSAGRVPLAPFVRLATGDQIILPDDGEVSLVFVDSGKQENWTGSGTLALGPDGGKATSGKPELLVRQLPPEVTRKMNQNLTGAQGGRVGMVRLRSLKSADGIAQIEAMYRDLRQQTSDSDVTPEAYLLGALFSSGEFGRLEQELARIGEQAPGNPSLAALHQLYKTAMAGAGKPPAVAP